MATCCFICVYSFESFVALQLYGLWCVQRLLRTEISFMVRGLTRDTAINQVDPPQCENELRFVWLSRGLRLPSEASFCGAFPFRRMILPNVATSALHDHKVIVLRQASAKSDIVYGAGMRRNGAEGRSPKAITKRYASTRARASIIGVYQPLSLPEQ